MVKAMQGDGLEWGEDYRPLARRALAGIIEGRMAEAVERWLDSLGIDDVADPRVKPEGRNGHYRQGRVAVSHASCWQVETASTRTTSRPPRPGNIGCRSSIDAVPLRPDAPVGPDDLPSLLAARSAGEFGGRAVQMSAGVRR